MQIAMVTCLIEAFMANSLASFLVSQKTIVLPWLPLYTWTTSPITAARWDQWHAMARCYRGNDRMMQQVNKIQQLVYFCTQNATFLFSSHLPQQLLPLFVFSCRSSRYACSLASCISCPLHTPKEGRLQKTEESVGWCRCLQGAHTRKWASIVLKTLRTFRSTLTWM